jgi:hypothetical protein
MAIAGATWPALFPPNPEIFSPTSLPHCGELNTRIQFTLGPLSSWSFEGCAENSADFRLEKVAKTE